MAENENNSEEQKLKTYHVIHAISLIIIGFGVGWLMGLSISPVVATVLSGILGAVLVLAAVLSGFSYGDNASLIKNISDISPVPFALLMLGIIAGTSSGIWVRTNNVLGIVSVEKQDNSFTKLQKELTQLKKQEDTEEQKKGKWEGLDISLSDIAQRIIDKHYPEGGVVNKPAVTGSSYETTSDRNNAATRSVLFSKELNDNCQALGGLLGQQLRREMSTGNLPFKELESYINDDEKLNELITDICKLQLYIENDKKLNELIVNILTY